MDPIIQYNELSKEYGPPALFNIQDRQDFLVLSFPQKNKLVVYDLNKNKFVLDINSIETKGESINIGA